MSTTTLSQIEGEIMNADLHGGGWIQLVFHEICSGPANGDAGGCGGYSITPANFNSLLTWIKSRGNAVKTVAQVMGDKLAAAPTPSRPPLHNASLENMDANGLPTCWEHAGWGTNTATWSTAPGLAGARAEQLQINGFSSGDAKLLTSRAPTCTPPVLPFHTYRLSYWYRSTVPSSIVVYLRDPNGNFTYWTTSPQVAPSTGWTQAMWTTPAIPDGETAIAWGPTASQTGTITLDALGMEDTAQGSPSIVQNASLESAPQPGATPTCWEQGGWGTSTFSWQTLSSGFAGASAQQLTVTSIGSGDRKLITARTPPCSIGVTAGDAYQLSAWYRSSAPVSFATYLDDGTGSYPFWIQSVQFPPSATWTQAVWTTPVVPAGSTQLSWGPMLQQVGTLSVDALGAYDASN